MPTLLLASLALSATPANPPAARGALLDLADALGEKVPGAQGIPGFPVRQLDVHQLQRAQPSPDLDTHKAAAVVAALERSRALSLDAYLTTYMQVFYQHVRTPLQQGKLSVAEIARAAAAAVDQALQRGE